MKKMLINATRPEELRVAITDAETQNLLDVILERQSYKTTVGNIYLAKVSSIEKSLGAAFINFGSERHGFLPMKEISKEYFEKGVEVSKNERPNIKELIKEGQYLMVQVEKEERGNKGAALTTFISLAGSYLVLMPNNPRAGGISRRVEGNERSELRDTLSDLPLPEGMGLIVRTAGVGKSAEELEWDLNNLLRQWDAIKGASLERDPPFFIHQESDLVTRIIRDYLRQDFSEIVIDRPELFEKVEEHLKQVRPDFVDKVKLYTNTTPIFNHYQIEQKIESAYQREVHLPSGGSIVIDHTEALVAVDVNSARATKGGNIEETALTTNMEAAEEIARQLRLRDIGGLVVIDFIDMSAVRNRREVETNLRNALKLDKARTQIGNVSSRFGLLEMSRQRLRHSLGEATQVTCPRCSGWGTIRSIESLSLSIIRMIEDDAVKPKTGQVQAQLPIDISTFMINEKRDMISEIEKRHNVEILIIPNQNLESPHYHIKRLTQSELPKSGKSKPSHLLVEQADTNTLYQKTEDAHLLDEQPAVGHILPSQPAPTKKTSSGLIKRLIGGLFGTSEEPPKPTIASKPRERKQTTRPTTRHTRPQTGNKTRNTKPPRGKSQTATGSTTRNKSNIPNKKEPEQTTDKSKEAQRSTHHKQDRKPSQRKRTTPYEKKVTQLPPQQAKEKKVTTYSTITTTQVANLPTPVNIPEQTKVETKPKTRRGSRGGRRRNNPNLPQKQETESVTPPDATIKKVQASPEHLPPFPTDIEGYYKQDLTRTADKKQKTNKPISKTNEQNKVESAKVPFEKIQNIKPIKEISSSENNEPIIVKPTPTPPKKTEKDEDDDKKVVGINVKIKDEDK